VNKTPLFEFHISKETRDFYHFDETFFAQTGNVIFSDYFHVRLFADKINRKRDLIASPDKTIRAGELNAMGLIDEILHYIAGLYKEQKNQKLFDEAEQQIRKTLGEKTYLKALGEFVETFPPLSVYKNEIDGKSYLEDETSGTSHRHIVLEEMMLLNIANLNPAFSPFKELFNDEALTKKSAYRKIIKELEKFFQTQPLFGPDHQYLYDMLRTPALRFPHSLQAQLEFIRERWGYLLSDFIYRLLGGLDLIREEERIYFGGPGPTYVPDFRSFAEDEPERFSTDLDWMPNVVMIAKSTYVWLDQLSKKYARAINRLDHIPDEELDVIARRGFNALWLIGLWERSSASQKIKQICGNPEAISSAYSLYDYIIASDLGGEEAYQSLRKRAWKKGIRIASDMVPNHTGIYSRWVVEHPEWYIQADNQVFPGYSFNGTNLSADERVALFIEDGYWNRSDAAVLFKRLDTYTGHAVFIYHGNDGTSMPWNDTAQLNYLLPEVREAVIQTILNVARRFSIIRLDAAMTLAKRHFQRLWFPQPGSGGDIPSRAGFAMTKEAFEKAFPVEFWREVVDRVAAEVPDTLLLAEAFWMMEGYFVRSLGMHRVYNSAFMNMLKNEENAKYRGAIKSVMDFNPQIMKRYVNFMNNPDEETAVAQFGKDDKYFGVCTLMVTLPGLPMFGHGQIEGYTEKYGMEYKRAYWEEQEDGYLIERHEREIFPLLKKRYLFSQVENFILYDLIGPDGFVNEDVFAYSNRSGSEKALVLYNNRYERSAGWIKYSSASAEKQDSRFKSFTLSEGLSFSQEYNRFIIFRDQISNLEYIRPAGDLAHHGLYAELDGFKYHVFLDFREVQENEYGHYGQLNDYLSGRGVPSIDQAMKETFLKPVHQPFLELLNNGFLSRLNEDPGGLRSREIWENELTDHFVSNLSEFYKRLKNYTSLGTDERPIIETVTENFRFLADIDHPKHLADKYSIRPGNKLTAFLKENRPTNTVLTVWLAVRDLGRMQDQNYAGMISLSWLDEFLLGKLIIQVLKNCGLDDGEAHRQLQLIKTLILMPDWFKQAEQNPGAALSALFQHEISRQFLQVNWYQDVVYFNYESLSTLLAGFVSSSLMSLSDGMVKDSKQKKKTLDKMNDLLSFFIKTAHDQGYRVYPMIEAAENFLH